jgi:dsDNA-specific endonuclease/ATPase MutS2
VVHTNQGQILCSLEDLRIEEELEFHPQKQVIQLPKKPGSTPERKGNSIDLHIEALKPELAGSLPERIINHQLDQFHIFLENSINQRIPFITIIHGKGTGVLREQVRQILKLHPQVKLIQPSRDDGATEAWLS